MQPQKSVVTNLIVADNTETRCGDPQKHIAGTPKHTAKTPGTPSLLTRCRRPTEVHCRDLTETQVPLRHVAGILQTLCGYSQDTLRVPNRHATSTFQTRCGYSSNTLHNYKNVAGFLQTRCSKPKTRCEYLQNTLRVLSITAAAILQTAVSTLQARCGYP